MILTEFGRPFVLKSDNGPCYTSREFHDFLEFYKIHHITSSPHYPQSNGFAEALVCISKKLMEKSVKDGKLWNYGLLEYRITQVSGNLPSPDWMQVKNLSSPDSIQCWEICGKFKNSTGVTEKIAQYFNPLFYGIQTRKACIHERSAWKCMENWCN